MTRYIDADTFKTRLEHEAWSRGHIELLHAIDIVNETPTIDAVPIKWLTAQAENPSNSDALRNAIDYIVYTLWAERKEE